LVRGAVQVAKALILEDLLMEHEEQFASESFFDVWAQAGELELPVAGDASLRLQIEDAQASLNLNALLAEGKPIDDRVEEFLAAVLEKVIDEMPGAPGQKTYDPRELAQNLIDWMDEDDVRLDGGIEDDYYQRQNPPYRARNKPLLAVEELRLVEGFDAALVEALEPYVGVYPLVGGEGINPNSAPTWVLALLYHGVGSEEYRMADEEVVTRLDKAREDGLLCAESADREDCTNLGELVPGTVFPPPSFASHVFRVRADARVGEVRRSLEVVLDRQDPQEPLLLDWRMR
jgi:type II secretory pathway component PulK